MTDHPFMTIALALEALADGEPAEMVLEADMDGVLHDAANVLRAVAMSDPTQDHITKFPVDDSEQYGGDDREHDEYPPCPICGDPIDYCLGHGATTEEDPSGRHEVEPDSLEQTDEDRKNTAGTDWENA